MVSPGRAPLVVASNRGPLSIVAVDDGDDEVRRGGGGLVSGMQAALSAVPDAVWICAALNDRERAMARRAASGRLSEVAAVADALAGDFDIRMLPIDAITFRQAYNGISNSTLWFLYHGLFDHVRRPRFLLWHGSQGGPAAPPHKAVCPLSRSADGDHHLDWHPRWFSFRLGLAQTYSHTKKRWPPEDDAHALSRNLAETR